ncbi:MAG: NAD(P)H-hydrate dehydratase, partial [Gemmatimonadaceae bacterium]
IAAGIDSWSLMHSAGSAAANFILQEFPETLPNGAVVYAGTGNNGGDAYVVASLLREAGVDVIVHAVGAPKTDDAKRAAELLRLTRAKSVGEPTRAPNNVLGNQGQVVMKPQIIVDGILGTGQRGELRDAEHAAARAINSAAQKGDVVVALDLPTGLNATTGEIAGDAVRADITVSFGTMKRAHVLQRGQVGEVVVFDIGLGDHAEKNDGAWLLAEPRMLAPMVPQISWNSHKGKRGRIAIVGGDHGMAGAIVLAARAALRSGAGLVYAYVAKDSVLPLQIAVPQAVAREWSESPRDVHAAAIGPGFGRSTKSNRRLDAVLSATHGVPSVLDADALTLIAQGAENADADLDEIIEPASPSAHAISRLSAIAANRPVVCTPHVGEFARLIGEAVAETLEGRVEQAQQFATRTGACILLKGTPTVVVSPNEALPIIVARGTPVLATGGSGDLLTGIIVALLGHGASPRDAAAIGAWVHGRAAELATGRDGSVRGVTLDEVLVAMPAAWSELSAGTTLPAPILAQLPAL